MKIGIFGGTFDPIHNGHLYIANNARRLLDLDKVIFVPSAHPPHKINNSLTPAEHRLLMSRLAIDGNEYFEVSDIEVKRQGLSYTFTTLKELQTYYGKKAKLYFICGADMLEDIPNWYKAKELVVGYSFIALSRPGFILNQVVQSSKLLKDNVNRISLLNIMTVEISSTLIRESLKSGISVKYLMPDNVIEYINSHCLYSIS